MEYIVKSGKNNIYCTDGLTHISSMVGPGGYSAKIYKSEKAAEKRAKTLVNGRVIDYPGQEEDIPPTDEKLEEWYQEV
jgi:hypothetical protein